jgi:acyl-CoA thioesterase
VIPIIAAGTRPGNTRSRDLKGVQMAKQAPLKSEGFNPFGDLIGLNFTQCENGRSRCVLEVSRKLMNPQSVVHGGVAYAMADTGMGGAMYSVMENDELCASIEIKMHYFKAVASGTLTCDTKILHQSRRIATLESEIRNGDELVAKAIGTFSVFKGRVPPR